MKPTILIVDDEKNIREMVLRGLPDFTVVGAADAEEAVTLLDEGGVDLCVVDVMMPGTNGFLLCDDIKRCYHKPVIMLTARSELHDKRQAFEAGSDDYMTKPFSTEELQFRIKAVLSRYRVSSEQLKLGNVELNPESYELYINDQTLYLPRKKFELLSTLVKREPKVAPRDELITEIWGYDFDGDERTIDVHIKRLRKRLAAVQATIEIVTVRGVGYKVHHV
ncbi:response regulator transcription factor [Macrococcus equipercicus]|uniref:Heme response regulator HssR n=1 Tax=Macrococcus equipercicus TaxID=69967 RepID=A0ABQ6RBY8_9STAP|nr:response regulator transcription factor [Macrococcus equipercicus]KAA1042755.1 response regulator transcription factor [Macrococcus equipercicus]